MHMLGWDAGFLLLIQDSQERPLKSCDISARTWKCWGSGPNSHLGKENSRRTDSSSLSSEQSSKCHSKIIKEALVAGSGGTVKGKLETRAEGWWGQSLQGLTGLPRTWARLLSSLKERLIKALHKLHDKHLFIFRFPWPALDLVNKTSSLRFYLCHHMLPTKKWISEPKTVKA